MELIRFQFKDTLQTGFVTSTYLTDNCITDYEVSFWYNGQWVSYSIPVKHVISTKKI